MKWLHSLERHFQPLAIPNLTIWLIAGQLLVFLMSFGMPDLYDTISLAPQKVIEGEWWRLLSFPFVPAFGGIFWVFCAYLFYLIGTALEIIWGTARYNLFVLVGYLSSIALAALLGYFAPEEVVATNAFFYGSVFLAFAYLVPEFELQVMFILPVKVKILAFLMLIGYVVQLGQGLATFTAGGWLIWVMLIASNLNISLFLGRDIADTLRRRGARIMRNTVGASSREVARHTCLVCGATNVTHPERDFRYCPQCQGTPAYCNEHLAGHQHLAAVAPQESKPK